MQLNLHQRVLQSRIIQTIVNDLFFPRVASQFLNIAKASKKFRYKLRCTGEAFVLSDFFIIYAGAYKQFYVGFVILLREEAKQTLGEVEHLNSLQERYELRRVFGVT